MFLFPHDIFTFSPVLQRCYRHHGKEKTKQNKKTAADRVSLAIKVLLCLKTVKNNWSQDEVTQALH